MEKWRSDLSLETCVSDVNGPAGLDVRDGDGNQVCFLSPNDVVHLAGWLARVVQDMGWGE